ncbi:hypothetical protein BDV95DRAFT_611785 [Massariosphaeria phaeospora]|uniref:Uncharacterized protein n=1 Tax=Massariosphaeria phaeospora TaxID=100035 RepID=A0A7C8M352_9PLEO|nr:hypothetical protein BDV95DRAFT_611785 [Massariosphaeria phaeospora]
MERNRHPVSSPDRTFWDAAWPEVDIGPAVPSGFSKRGAEAATHIFEDGFVNLLEGLEEALAQPLDKVVGKEKPQWFLRFCLEFSYRRSKRQHPPTTITTPNQPFISATHALPHNITGGNRPTDPPASHIQPPTHRFQKLGCRPAGRARCCVACAVSPTIDDAG